MKNIIAIWKNKGEILEGIKNNVFKKEHVEEIATERYSACQKCDKLDLEGTECLVPGTSPCCGECGCSLQLKLRSLGSECPLKKWDAVLSHEENYLLQQNLKKEDNE
jgi:hypothetical protein